MTKEEKDLLLRDLCARLPYGVFVKVLDEIGYEHICKINGYLFDTFRINSGEYDVDEIEPYLRPLSSMTEEEEKELSCFGWFLYPNGYGGESYIVAEHRDDPLDYGGYRARYVHNEDLAQILDWLNAHHFDFRNLIEKGLALEAPEGMYNTKTE